MASVMNIQGLTPVEDPEYRYKMPRIIGKVEGRGNGIKTAIPNMTQLAQSLARDPGEVTKFFGCELGAQTTWNPETERAIVNGAHTTQDLQQNVFKYIELFILCQQCGNPETEYKIKNEIISQKCAACGHKGVLKDMQHKLTTFILAQHKKAKSAKSKDDKKKDKKDKKKKDGEEGDGEKDKKKKKKDKTKEKDKDKKKKKKKKEKKEGDEDEEAEEEANAGAAAEPEDDESPEEDEDDEEDNEEEDEGDDNSEDADAAPGSGGAPIEALEAEEISSMESAVRRFTAFLEEAPSPQEQVAFVRNIQTTTHMPLSHCAYVMVQVFFDENIVKEGQVEQHAAALSQLIKTDANMFMARHFLGALEEFFCKVFHGTYRLFPLVLKQLYDEDILEEEAILDWAKAGITHQFSPTSIAAPDLNDLRASAEPFVVWLKEADEEDDEDDDEA